MSDTIPTTAIDAATSPENDAENLLAGDPGRRAPARLSVPDLPGFEPIKVRITNVSRKLLVLASKGGKGGNAQIAPGASEIVTLASAHEVAKVERLESRKFAKIEPLA